LFAELLEAYKQDDKADKHLQPKKLESEIFSGPGSNCVLPVSINLRLLSEPLRITVIYLPLNNYHRG